MRNILAYSLILLVVITAGCEYPPGVEKVSRLYIKNNSANTVYLHRSYKYPDTTIPDEYYINGNGNLQPGSTAPLDSKKPWKDVINDLPADTISIILFDVDTINHYGWESVRKEHRVLKRWNVDVNYLEQRNWILIYPE